MSTKSDVWHVRGVSEETRKVAKMGAVTAGVTIGEWLEFAIAQSKRAVFGEKVERKVKPRSEVLGALQPTPGGVELTEYFLAKTEEEEEILIPPGLGIEPRKKEEDEEPIGGVVHKVYEVGVSKKMRAAVKKTCAHGEAKGNNCWQCGGLAKVVE